LVSVHAHAFIDRFPVLLQDSLFGSLLPLLLSLLEVLNDLLTHLDDLLLGGPLDLQTVPLPRSFLAQIQLKMGLL